MMPAKVVTLHRWQAVGILVAMTLAYVLAACLTTWESRQRSDANRDLIVAIQHQRAEVTYTSCLDQNDRHDQTIERLDQLLDKAVAANPAAAEQIRRTRSSTVFLIEALAPHQKCKQIVMDRFGFVPVLPETARRLEDG